MRGRKLLAMGALVVMVAGGFGVSSANHCDGNHRTAAGSCKTTSSNPQWEIQCGPHGKLPVSPGGVGIHVNQNADGAEVEACSNQGVGNQHGRLVVQASRSQEGARVVLDSDPHQPFDPGWITVQASAKQGNQNGVYCSADAGETHGPAAGDGYARPWTSPGPDNGADCIPDPPF